jgi:NTP pyrophosphatase (non-canonical NTP hydrolase)
MKEPMNYSKTDLSKTNYSAFVETLVKEGQDIIDDLDPSSAHLLHMAVGVAGEAGELLDAIKKMAIYKKPLDVENVIEELGDLYFYMQGIQNALEISRDEIIQSNVDKLKVRYDLLTGYSNKSAQERSG